MRRQNRAELTQFQGSTVTEDQPVRLSYLHEKLVSEGRPRLLTTEIYVCSDPGNDGAPLYSEDGKFRIIS